MSYSKICEMVSDRIINQLDEGQVPWHKPWVGVLDTAVSHSTLRSYSLLNQLLLNGVPGEYATFNQVKNAGGTVKKGAKAKPIVFWKVNYKDENGKFLDGDKLTREEKRGCETVPFLRYYSVFHIEIDCEGTTPKRKDELNAEIQQHADAEEVLMNYLNREGIDLRRDEKSNEAAYCPSGDFITVPIMEQFRSQAEFYSTVFHELTHSTGHESRLKRFSCGNMDKSERGLEELIAEIGACALLNHVGLSSDDAFNNSVAYIDSWRRAIKQDSSLIVTAANRAEKAIAYIIGEKETEEETTNAA